MEVVTRASAEFPLILCESDGIEVNLHYFWAMGEKRELLDMLSDVAMVM